jgi:orotidine-5'-phosphate decarboxylase
LFAQQVRTESGGIIVKFIDRLKANLAYKNSHVCVGLDSQYGKLPGFIKKNRSIAEAVFDFNKKIIDQTHDLAIFYKMNISFYAGYGAEGLEGLRLTNEYIKANYPEIQILADCKRSEMEESVKMVAAELFGWLHFDCVMATPWFGFDTLRDYLVDDTKGVIVYAHDSNPSAVEIQDLLLADGRRVYEVVARKIASDWNANGNLMAEAGLTYPNQLRKIRLIIGDEAPLLVAAPVLKGGRSEIWLGCLESMASA